MHLGEGGRGLNVMTLSYPLARVIPPRVLSCVPVHKGIAIVLSLFRSH